MVIGVAINGGPVVIQSLRYLVISHIAEPRWLALGTKISHQRRINQKDAGAKRIKSKSAKKIYMIINFQCCYVLLISFGNVEWDCDQ